MNMGIIRGSGVSGLSQNDSGLVVVDQLQMQEDLQKEVEHLKRQVEELQKSRDGPSIQESPQTVMAGQTIEPNSTRTNQSQPPDGGKDANE